MGIEHTSEIKAPNSPKMLMNEGLKVKEREKVIYRHT